MSVERQLIAEFVSDIWRHVAGRTVEPTPDLPSPGDGWAFACVQITGAWRGTVTVAADAGLVRAAAAALFFVSPDEASDAEQSDALGELAGMLAVNLKAILPAPCYLSRPAVAAGDGSEPPGVSRRRVLRCGFADPAGKFVVTVAETSRPTGRRRHPERPSNINPLSDCEASGRFPQVIAEDYVIVTPAPRGDPATPPDPLR
ncbi:MAG: chemotaxis protein CheX [Fimbriiglobus sp.]|jgi:CheY-specific phosphatase CheX|nr:chemotaxis protein CheX [Fimbriiglobus sp.]